MKALELNLALKARVFGTRKWLIVYSASTVWKVSLLLDRASMISSDSSSSSKSSKSFGPISSSSSSSANISCRRRSAFFFCWLGILNLKPVSSARCSTDVKPLLPWSLMISLVSSLERGKFALFSIGHLEPVINRTQSVCTEPGTNTSSIDPFTVFSPFHWDQWAKIRQHALV